jgi:hypothetical protein
MRRLDTATSVEFNGTLVKRECHHIFEHFLRSRRLPNCPRRRRPAASELAQGPLNMPLQRRTVQPRDQIWPRVNNSHRFSDFNHDGWAQFLTSRPARPEEFTPTLPNKGEGAVQYAVQARYSSHSSYRVPTVSRTNRDNRLIERWVSTGADALTPRSGNLRAGGLGRFSFETTDRAGLPWEGWSCSPCRI